jgi:C_GCAxxG_C_C family probable redox protein
MSESAPESCPESPAKSPGQYARSLFGPHFCAEAVLTALARHLGVASPLIPKIATGLCSGVSRTGSTCGAVSGALLGIGLALGRENPPADAEARAELEHCYAACQEFLDRFQASHGQLTCKGLTGCDFSDPVDMARFRELGLLRHCYDFVEFATDTAAAIIDEEWDEAPEKTSAADTVS